MIRKSIFIFPQAIIKTVYFCDLADVHGDFEPLLQLLERTWLDWGLLGLAGMGWAPLTSAWAGLCLHRLWSARLGGVEPRSAEPAWNCLGWVEMGRARIASAGLGWNDLRSA